MTLPNKLTLFRLYTAPVIFFIWYVLIHKAAAPLPGIIILWILLIAGEITDILDGHIARRRNLVSDIGRLMDPFTDVFLRVTYFLCFTGAGLMPLWAFAVILWRELGIMFLRMLLAKEGITLAASMGGKLKSVLYALSGLGGMVALTTGIAFPGQEALKSIETILPVFFALSALAALLSFLAYFANYRKTESHQRFLEEG